METSKKKDAPKPIYNFSHGNVTGAVILDTRRPKEKGLYPVRYRITFQRDSIYYKSGYDCSLEEWAKMPNTRIEDLISKRKLIKSGFDIIENNVKEIKDVFSFDALNKRMGRGKIDSVSSAFEIRIAELKNSGQIGTAEIYNSSKLFITEYKDNLKFIDITPKFLESFEVYALKKIKYATLGMYLRNLRALFNIAIKEGVITAACYPFQKTPNDGGYKIKVGSGTKTALTVEQLSKFINYDSPFKGKMKSKDIFLLSFYLGGIGIKDLLLLKWENIQNNELVYSRSKTIRTIRSETLIRIPLSNDVKVIIDKYGNEDKSPKARILPLMPVGASPSEIRKISLNVVRNINRDLYKIADELGIENLSSYVARHSMATLMKNSGVSESFIKEVLGHQNIKTTQNYLKSFEQDQRRETFLQVENALKKAMDKLKKE